MYHPYTIKCIILKCNMFTAAFILAIVFHSGLAATLLRVPGSSNHGFHKKGNVASFLVEGDVITSHDIVKQNNYRLKRSARDYHRDSRWSGGIIPYTLDVLYSSVEKAVILGAMEEIEQKTCIQFVARSSEHDYIRIFPHHDGGCFAFIGRKGGQQPLSLGQTCIRGRGKHRIALHELMHAIGFIHEHNRPDRRQYVRIHWQNMQPWAFDYFAKRSFHEVDYLNTEYDYGSIMHYGRYTYSRNPSSLETIEPLNSTAVIGEATNLSAVDVIRVNRLYNCSGIDHAVA